VRNTLVIARRELASMFGGPLAWVLGAVFALLTGYFFYSDLTFYVLFGGANLGTGFWRYMFLDFRMVAMLVVPLVTMRLLAEERKLGTLELLWTFPVRDREVIAGKFLAALLSYAAMLVPTLVGPAVLYAMHPFPLGPLVAGYAGMLLLGAAFIACGLAASAVTDSQGVSALLTYGVLVLSWFLAWNEAALSARVAPVVVALSLFDRFYGFAQGGIDSRDVAYFMAFIALFLFLALRSLQARSWRGVS
jgi:ABC-2 type transport system permease protein